MRRQLKKLLLLALAISPYQANSTNSLEVAPGFYFFNYKEFNQADQLLDKEEGTLPGVKINFSQKQDLTTLQTHFAVYSGTVDYIGQTQSGTPHRTDTDTSLVNLGLELLLEDVSILRSHLFFGFQYWRWDRDILTRNNVQGLHEIYHWYELEMGLRFNSEIVEQSWYWLDLSGLYVTNANMKIRLPSSRLTLDLGSSPGARLRAGKSWSSNENLRLSLAFFAEYWEFGRSNTLFTDDFYGQAAYITEPRSESFHSGLEFSFSTRF